LIGLPDSFLKQYNEKHSPHTLFGVISSSIQSGADWATALLNWAKRKEITINGASKTADAVFGTSADQVIDDFTTYTDQTDADASWVSSDTGIIRANPTTDLLDAVYTQDGTNNSISYDLTSISDTAWTIRWKHKLTAITSNPDTHMLISASDSSTDMDTAQDSINVRMSGTALNTLSIGSSDGAVPEASPSDTLTLSWTVGDTRYYELKRLSATSIKLIIYSDSEYTEVLGTISKKLNMLVIGDSKPKKNKIDKAKELKIDIINEKDWYKLLDI